ncbi:hypothetical protein BJY04DRAFT_220220 [Aspergillus karnatakaensis]|uniref:uncharacterized protein n=1 Tax=Aspergillus karnatakaensis TaxID=1810916 RepID=UPI003CCD7CB1
MDSKVTAVKAVPATDSKTPVVTGSKLPEPATAAAATLSPRASTALAHVLAALNIEPGAKHPEICAVQAWDLGRPIPLSDAIPMFYDASTAEYFLFTDKGALVIYKTPRFEITKKRARQIVSVFPDSSNAVDVIGREFNFPKSNNPLLPDRVIVWHAVHDSIIVKRNSRPTGLFEFAFDKTFWWLSHQGGISTGLFPKVSLQYVRPTFDHIVPHICSGLHQFPKELTVDVATNGYRFICAPPKVVGRVTLASTTAQQRNSATAFITVFGPDDKRI